ncbi:MAG: histidine triad nucleotide-binding protein [Elusimicrobia bacterium]|nr:histidine triad nucleotide-binding protein [Elusimicrobiota bacterium]
MSDCLFCRITRKEIPAQIVFESDLALAFKDINPQAPTHILIIPKKHLTGLSVADPEDAPVLGEIQIIAKNLAEQMNLTTGYRLVLNNGRGAGQSVDHLHYHLLGGRRMTWPPG